MGLFDRFRKRVHEVAEQTDAEALSADEGSEEARAAELRPGNNLNHRSMDPFKNHQLP